VVNLEVISTPIKRLEQQDLLMVKLEVISTPMKRLEQQDLLVVKLEVISTPIKRLEQPSVGPIVSVVLLEGLSPPV
jgi:hypothetical protein